MAQMPCQPAGLSMSRPASLSLSPPICPPFASPGQLGLSPPLPAPPTPAPQLSRGLPCARGKRLLRMADLRWTACICHVDTAGAAQVDSRSGTDTCLVVTRKSHLRQEDLTDPPLSGLLDDMTEATDLAAAAGSSDPRVGLRAVRALRILLEKLEVIQVGNARDLGWSWQEIAESLGVSKQAVHQKHGGGRRLGNRR